MAVVVSDVNGEAFELQAVPDDGPVEQFAADLSDPAFRQGVGYWGADWCFEDLEAFGSKDRVEAVDELSVVAAQEHGIDGEEVTRDRRLGAQELDPGRS